MKQIGKKLLSATLSALMIVSAFSACGSSPSDAAETSAPASESSSASADSQSTEIPKTGTATGAYVQESMSENLPDTYSRFYDLRIDQDGNVLLVGLNSTGKRQLLQFESSTWTVLQESDMPANAPNYVDIADDGSIWAVTRNSDGQYSLCTGQDANALEPVEVDSLLQSGALPVGLRLTDDGKVFLTVQVAESTIFVLIDCATRQVTTITPGFYGSPVLYSEGKVYAFVTGSTNLTVFDANSGNTLQQYQLPLAEFLPSTCAASVNSGVLTWADSNGIHQLALDGMLQQTFADNRSFVLASNEFIKQQLVVDQDGSYWVSGMDGNNHAQLYRYHYDAEATIPSGSELVIWAMEDSFLLREGINAYAAQHPEQTITVEYGQDSINNGMTLDDVIRTLNVEIFAGEGPDVLVLDGLPIESYIDQGILADLSQVDTDDCYKNIVNCYTDSDGCWALPLLFRPGLLYCKSQENAEPLSQAQCLTDLQDLLCVKSNFHYDGYYNLFNELYPASSASIFALGAQEVNESALREFLTVTEAVVQAQNITSEFDPLFGDGEDTAGTSDGQHLAVDIPVSMNWYARPQDPADCATGCPTDYLLTYIYMVSETQAVPALIRPFPGDVFVPAMTMGVLNTSDQIDAGVEFIQTMLDCENEQVADRGSFNGYFVREGVQMRTTGGSSDLPTPAELGLDTVCAQLTTPANTDLSLKELVYDEASQLYSGNQDLETTIANILQRASLYYAEQR